MPIDPNIAFQYKGVEFPDPVNALAKTMQLQNMVQEQQLNALKLKKAGLDTRQKMYTQAIGRAGNKQQAAAITEQMFADPVVGPVFSRFGTKEQAIAEIPDDPKEFGYWKLTQSGASPLDVAKLKQKEQQGPVSKIPSDISTMSQLGYPLTQQGFEQFKAAGRQPGAQTIIEMPKLHTAEETQKGKFNVKQYENISQAADIGLKNLSSLDTQSRILDKGFETGFGTDAIKAGASVLARLGVDRAEEYATNAQSFLAATQDAVLQKQLQQKGAQTNKDAERIQQTAAQLGNTPNANKFLIDVAKAQIKRDIAQRDFWNDYWNKNRTFEGVENAWNKQQGDKSLFESPELKRYAAPAAPGGKTGTASSKTGQFLNFE